MGKIERVPAGTAPRTRRVGEPLFMERHKTGDVRIGTCRFISSPPRHFRTRLSYSAASRLKNAPLSLLHPAQTRVDQWGDVDEWLTNIRPASSIVCSSPKDAQTPCE